MIREMSLTGFMSHLTNGVMTVSRVQQSAMEQACRVIEAEAKRELGTYQDGAGSFVAWAELADSTKDQRVALGFSENEPGLRTGEMRDSIRHQATPELGVVGSDDENLVYFELGTSKQPPRSVLALAALHTGEKVAKILGGSMVAALTGNGVVNGRLEISEP